MAQAPENDTNDSNEMQSQFSNMHISANENNQSKEKPICGPWHDGYSVTIEDEKANKYEFNSATVELFIT